MNNDKQIIFILDDEDQILEMFKKFLSDMAPSYDVFCFNNHEDLLKHPLLKYVSLFIFDVNLRGDITGDELALQIHDQDHPAPFLFMSGKGYTFESFNDKDLTYDYLSKPFNLDSGLNRIKVLLKVSEQYRSHQDEKTKFQITLKEFDLHHLI